PYRSPRCRESPSRGTLGSAGYIGWRDPAAPARADPTPAAVANYGTDLPRAPCSSHASRMLHLPGVSAIILTSEDFHNRHASPFFADRLTDRELSPGTRNIDEFAVPQLEHQQHPQGRRVVAGAGLVLGPQPRHGIRPEVAALASALAQEHVLPEVPQRAAQ